MKNFIATFNSSFYTAEERVSALEDGSGGVGRRRPGWSSKTKYSVSSDSFAWDSIGNQF